MFYVYVLESGQNGKFYTGFTSNLKIRLKSHLEGKVYSTKRWQPWKLVYYESCISKYDALQRERYLKTGRGEEFIKNRLKYYLAILRNAYIKKTNKNSSGNQILD